jgi:SNF2 family DNA or RNA helicase
MEQYEDIGRTINYGGFTGTVDRIVNLYRSQQWDCIRCDGRGWVSNIEGLTDPKDMIRLFQDKKDSRRIGFIAHPSSAGMGLTLTASPMSVYYSNDFNGESRIQSADRNHRLGMDENRGATVYDIFHLPTDEYVLDNLNKKTDLQALVMGNYSEYLNKAIENEHYYN